MTEIERCKLLVKENRRLFQEIKQNYASFTRLYREIRARQPKKIKRRNSN